MAVYLTAVVIIIVVLILKKLGLKMIDLPLGKVEYREDAKKRSLIFSPSFSIDPVISENGKVYKKFIRFIL